MSSTDLKLVKDELVKAGVEIYRTVASEIQLAERVRYHIMDSGVRVVVDDSLEITFTARTQRSDFPSVDSEQLFEKVRDAVGREAIERGYREKTSLEVEVKDPVDDAKILDTWHEVVYAKGTEELPLLVDEVRWALALEKYIAP